MAEKRNARSAPAFSLPESFAYTELLEDAKNTLSKNLSALHTKEEARSLLELLSGYASRGRYDAMWDPDKKMRRILSDSCPDFAALLEADGKKPEEARDFPYFYDASEQKRIEYALQTYAEQIERLPTLAQLDVRFFQMLYDCFDRYRSSADYLTRFVRQRLSQISPELLENDAPTGVLILRQLIRQFGCGTAAVNGEICKIEDRDKGPNQKNTNSYFCPALQTLCETAYGGDTAAMAKGLTEAEYRDLLKNAETGCRLALIAEQLAAGRFNSQGKTREFLYIFAIAFEMRCTELGGGAAEENGAPDGRDLSDLTRNLFYDYYTDNLVNARSASEKKEIDGYGINWKNFIEVIYLYYLSDAAGDMPPALRFYKAVKGCYYCRKKGATADKLPETRAEEKTELFRERFSLSLMRLPEAEFLDAVARTYECRLNESKKTEMTQQLVSQLEKTNERIAELEDRLKIARGELLHSEQTYAERKEQKNRLTPTLRLLKTAVHADAAALEALCTALLHPAERASAETLGALQKEITRLSVYPTAAQFYAPEEVETLLPALTDPRKNEERAARLREITGQLKGLADRRRAAGDGAAQTAARHASQALASAKETLAALQKRIDALQGAAERAKYDRRDKKRICEGLKDKLDRLKNARRSYEEDLRPERHTSLSAVSFASEKRTAAEAYEWLIRHTDTKQGSLWLLGVFELSDSPGEGIPYKIGKKPARDDGETLYVSKDFVQCVDRFTERYYSSPEETDRLNYKQLPVVYRSDLLFAASDYIVSAAKEDDTLRVIGSFEDYYRYFCGEAPLNEDLGVNALLRRCGYQEISDKSIFDLLILYLSYKKSLSRTYLPVKKRAR